MTTPLPCCPHCKSCIVGMRQIVSQQESQSQCPWLTRHAVSCACCGVQGPVGNTVELARTLWSEWCARSEAANEGNIAQLMMAKQTVKEVEHLLDSVRNQRDRSESDKGMLRAENNALKRGHADQAKIISGLHESLALGRDAIDKLTKELGEKTNTHRDTLISEKDLLMKTLSDKANEILRLRGEIDQNNNMFEQIRSHLDPHGLRGEKTLVEVARISGRLDSVCKQRDTAEKDREILREQNQRLCDQVTELTQQRNEQRRITAKVHTWLDEARRERDDLRAELAASTELGKGLVKTVASLSERMVSNTERDFGDKTLPVDLVDAIRHYLTSCGDVHPRNISPSDFATYLMKAGTKAGPDPSRLIAAIEAAMPLLGTQKDAVKRLEAVPAVYREPLTTAQLLRKQADELDHEDAIVTELRAAWRQYVSGEKQ